MHVASTAVPNIDATDSTKVGQLIYSRVWKVGGSPESAPSIFFDVSCRSERLAKVLSRINHQFPDNCGARTHREGPRVLVEVFFEDAGVLDSALTIGLKFDDGVCILPTRALSVDAKITKVRLSNLPFRDPTKLLEGLKQSLALYGRVLD